MDVFPMKVVENVPINAANKNERIIAKNSLNCFFASSLCSFKAKLPHF